MFLTLWVKNDPCYAFAYIFSCMHLRVKIGLHTTRYLGGGVVPFLYDGIIAQIELNVTNVIAREVASRCDTDL